MSKVQIKVMDNGSFRVTGDVELIDADGTNLKQSRHFHYADVASRKRCPFATEIIKENSTLVCALQKF